MRFVYIAFIVCLNNACAQQLYIESCAGGLTPIVTNAPKFPPGLHNEYEGYAIVYLVVDKDGTVLEAEIKEEEWNPVGNSMGKPIGYRDAIVEAYLKNKYIPPVKKCSMTMRASIVWND